MRFLNMDLIGNPLNWVTVFLMLAFGLILLSLFQPSSLEQ